MSGSMNPDDTNADDSRTVDPPPAPDAPRPFLLTHADTRTILGLGGIPARASGWLVQEASEYQRRAAVDALARGVFDLADPPLTAPDA